MATRLTHIFAALIFLLAGSGALRVSHMATHHAPSPACAGGCEAGDQQGQPSDDSSSEESADCDVCDFLAALTPAPAYVGVLPGSNMIGRCAVEVPYARVTVDTDAVRARGPPCGA